MIRLRHAFISLSALAVLPLLPGADAPTAPATPKAPLVDTVIESGSAEMISTAKETTFTFSKGVTVTATNMKMTSDNPTSTSNAVPINSAKNGCHGNCPSRVSFMMWNSRTG